MKWQVNIPAGRWMGGYTHTFSTKAKAVAFINRWNHTEITSGNESVPFNQSGHVFASAVKDDPWNGPAVDWKPVNRYPA